ncbi:MAG: hypothetical protein EA401_07345 [Planctomycetota bacterium]|nr:MAG: hypothetical protein EA401_07345 [Planctomycetota bacterium]
MRLGSGRQDITPTEAIPLLGYDFRQEHALPGNSGVRDRLWLRVLALDAEDGAGLALIITCDLCIISVEHARHWRQMVAQRWQLDPARIIISCSHTHSGPWLDERGVADDVAAVLPHTDDSKPNEQRRRYTTQLDDHLLQAVARAVGLMYPVEVSSRETPLGLGYCRRVALPDQTAVAQCWNPEEYPHLQPDPQADPALTAVIFRQRNGHRCWMLWCHGAHPVVLGKTSTRVSADWPGVANAYLQDQGIEGHFLLGACGDVHPWISTAGDDDGVEIVGRSAGAVLHLLSRSGGNPHPTPALHCSMQEQELGGRSIDLSYWRIADVAIAASPTELFASLAAQLRQQHSTSPLMVATNCNGWTGYWPDADAFAQGGYEIRAALAMGRQPGDGERLIHLLSQGLQQS